MLSRFRNSTIGRKYLMGFSGVIWTAFVLAHMAGNMLMFVSPEAYNAYGHALTSGSVIYVVETLLVASISLHVLMGVFLTIKNKRARGAGYAMNANPEKRASTASRTMIYHGSIILIFIILHLATFKYGTVYMTQAHGVQVRDLFRLMVEVFAQPGYVAWYVVCLILLGFHLRHGVSSVFQSFGLLHPSYQRPIKIFGNFYSFIVAAGFLSQPLYIFFFLK